MFKALLDFYNYLILNEFLTLAINMGLESMNYFP